MKQIKNVLRTSSRHTFMIRYKMILISVGIVINKLKYVSKYHIEPREIGNLVHILSLLLLLAI